MLTLNGRLRAKDALRLFSKYLRDKICKIKQYLNFILIRKDQNNPNDILTSGNISMENLIVTNRQLPKLPLLNVLAKFLTESKYLKSNFTFARIKYLYMRLLNL